MLLFIFDIEIMFFPTYSKISTSIQNMNKKIMFFCFVEKQKLNRNSPYFFIIHLNDLKIELCLIVPIQRNKKKGFLI